MDAGSFFSGRPTKKILVQKGVFRVHLISGTAIVWVSPYFIYSVWINEVPNLLLAALGGILGAFTCLTGLRMLVLLNRKDTRMRRWFFSIIIFVLAAPITELSAIFLLNDNKMTFFLGKSLALVGLLCTVFTFGLILSAIPSYFGPHMDLMELHNDQSALPRFSWQKILSLLRPKTDSKSRMYSIVGSSKFGRFLVWFFGDFLLIPLCIAGTIITWRLVCLPVSVISGSALRSTEGIIAFNLFIMAPQFWSIFEMTLFSRGDLNKLHSWLAIILGFIAPLVSVYLLLPLWFESDFASAFLRALFLDLPPS